MGYTFAHVFGCASAEMGRGRFFFFFLSPSSLLPPGGGGTPYNGLYGEAPPERGIFFRLQVYKRVEISQV